MSMWLKAATRPVRSGGSGDGTGDQCILTFRNGRPCTEPAAATVSVNCQSEHADTGRLCRRHVETAQKGVMECLRCKDAGNPGRHVFVTKVVWDR
jgi:hypothetical protein